jgi:glucosamine--fructose-6-phosphate aminotransferase (isomerizing)
MSETSLTYTEILKQPASWAETIRQVPSIWKTIRDQIEPESISHALFMGSGTSLYIGQSAAQSFMEITGITASAIPTSEAFLSAASTVPRSGHVLAFIISRSGTTSEALIAATYLREHHLHITTIGVTCNDGTELASRCEHCIALPFATERSVVMTQSFTTMLLALQVVAALVDGADALLTELADLPGAFDEQLPAVETLAQRFGAEKQYDTTIYLGLGPNQGLAEEGTLKLKEMTQSTCEAYSPMEFRHGPISIVDERTLIILFEGVREQAYLPDVRRDLKQHGARIIAVGPHEASDADETLGIGRDFSDLARCVLYMPFVQLLAYRRALSLGLDPDRPRNLNQVVVLDAQ